MTLDPSASVTYVTSLSSTDVVRCLAVVRVGVRLRITVRGRVRGLTLPSPSNSDPDQVRCFADSRAEAPLRECELRPVAESETDALLLFGPFQEF